MKDKIILAVKEAINNNVIYRDSDDDAGLIYSEDIDHIAEQVADKLLKQGRLIEFPKKVYEVCYVLGWEIVEFNITAITYSCDGVVERIEASRPYEATVFTKSKIGKTDFLTKEEAKAKLQELKGEQK